jgi:CBS domain-containing protein
MAVAEICNREVVVTGKSASVVDAAQLMRTHHVGDLVVIEERDERNYPVGIVTDRDIVVEVVAAGVNAEALRVGDIMGPEVATVRESEGLFEALRYMRDKGVRRMPVVGSAGELVGILTMDDVLSLLAEEMTVLAKLVSHERQRERWPGSRLGLPPRVVRGGELEWLVLPACRMPCALSPQVFQPTFSDGLLCKVGSNRRLGLCGIHLLFVNEK